MNICAPQGDYAVHAGASKTLVDSLMYKVSYHDFGQIRTDANRPPGFDRVRGTEIGDKVRGSGTGLSG